mgnify:CR=1 FL=1
MKELAALAKAKPGEISFAGSGSGSTPHLAGELLKHMTGVDITHVPFRGGAASGTEIIAGRIDMLIDNVPNSIGHIRGGQMRALAERYSRTGWNVTPSGLRWRLIAGTGTGQRPGPTDAGPCPRQKGDPPVKQHWRPAFLVRAAE